MSVIFSRDKEPKRRIQLQLGQHAATDFAIQEVNNLNTNGLPKIAETRFTDETPDRRYQVFTLSQLIGEVQTSWNQISEQRRKNILSRIFWSRAESKWYPMLGQLLEKLPISYDELNTLSDELMEYFTKVSERDLRDDNFDHMIQTACYMIMSVRFLGIGGFIEDFVKQKKEEGFSYLEIADHFEKQWKPKDLEVIFQRISDDLDHSTDENDILAEINNRPRQIAPTHLIMALTRMIESMPTETPEQQLIIQYALIRLATVNNMLLDEFGADGVLAEPVAEISI